jgi:hypothetical protein
VEGLCDEEIYKRYLALAVIFSLSATVSYVIPADDKFKAIAATPAILTLFGALLQLLRDAASFEEQQDLRCHHQIIDRCPASQMTNVGLDKEDQSCEKRMDESDVAIGSGFED